MQPTLHACATQLSLHTCQWKMVLILLVDIQLSNHILTPLYVSRRNERDLM